MAEIRRCAQCGRLIPEGKADCPECALPATASWRVSRKALIAASLLLLALLFFAAGFATRAFHTSEKKLAEIWFERGERELTAKKPEGALDAFYTALRYSPENSLYQLRLAEALISAKRSEEARSYLLGLWERDPQSGPVNYDLGRLSAGEGDVADTIRYYHNALYGLWEAPDINRRRALRLEVYRFLRARGANEQAEGELMALSGEVPRDARAHEEIGELLLQSADYNRALKEFRLAAEIHPRLEGALAGAGEASFQMGQYFEATRYLTRAVAVSPRDTKSRALLETTALVLSLDPFDPRLSIGEKSRRAARAFGTAMERLKNCAQERGVRLDAAPTVNDLQSQYAQGLKLAPQARPAALMRAPDAILRTMDFVFQAESAATRVCGPATGADRALEIIAERHGGSS